MQKEQKQCNNDPDRRSFNPQIPHIYHSFTVVNTNDNNGTVAEDIHMEYYYIINILNMLKE